METVSSDFSRSYDNVLTGLRLAPLMLGLSLVACARAASGPEFLSEYSLSQASDSVPLVVGRETRVATLWLTFTGVPEDSRCPTDVVCVWEGDAVAEITAHPPCYKEGCLAPSAQFRLHTTLEPKSAEYFGYRVTLVRLMPHPVSTRHIEQREYVAWVKVTQANPPSN